MVPEESLQLQYGNVLWKIADLDSEILDLKQIIVRLFVFNVLSDGQTIDKVCQKTLNHHKKLGILTI